ncbi:MAG TPA: hypothetical protein VFS43_30855 [Polyangiaceae bacterium]|nr:hypothetical protein [Polyangiaceae bacterium]
MLTTATTTPERRLSTWEAELAAGYLSAPGARPPPPADLLGVVAGEWPELAQSAASRGLSLELFGLSREAPSLGGAHGIIFSVYASWSQGPSFETQRCFLWLGPAGLVRLSGRPEALRAALAAGPWRPGRAPADELAGLIANALVLHDRPDRGDDPWGVRQGRMRSAVLTTYALDHLDSGGSFAPLRPVSHERWRALRPWLVPPQLLPERDKLGHCLVFWLIESLDTQALFRPFGVDFQ